MPATKIPRANTKQRKLLQFVGDRTVTYSEIQRFFVELNGLNYNEMQEESIWGYGGAPSRKVMRRRYRGYYSTAISRIILPNYFTRTGKAWKLKSEVLAELNGTAQKNRDLAFAKMSDDSLNEQRKHSIYALYHAQQKFQYAKNELIKAQARADELNAEFWKRINNSFKV